ncbi:MAG: hypothetical protein JHC93_06415 [Parachlamydiales bacterium]|nr:hypothetical protein [Parachlamydiales bacterium]
MKEYEWDWLTVEQIQNLQWRHLFSSVPISSIPTLMNKIIKMEGIVGVSVWKVHLLSEFVDSQREIGFPDIIKERLLVGLRCCDSSLLIEVARWLSLDELIMLESLYCPASKLAFCNEFLERIGQQENSSIKSIDLMHLFLIALLCDAKKFSSVKDLIIEDFILPNCDSEDIGEFVSICSKETQLQKDLSNLFSDEKRKFYFNLVVESLLRKMLSYFYTNQTLRGRHCLFLTHLLCKAIGDTSLIATWLYKHSA